MTLVQLPQSTIKLITSTQIITSVSSVIKELVENALDAGATSVEVKLINYGLSQIEVRDNGSGINTMDTMHMALPHYTSKIKNFCDLEHVSTYGFRGEALNAICQVSEVIITTTTSTDFSATTYTLDSSGNVIGSKPSQRAQGTTVTVSNLFKNVPVRRQYLSSDRNLKEELKHVETLVKSLAVIKSTCRVTLSHNKNLIWQKPSCTSLQSSFSHLVGYSTNQHLECLSFTTLNQIKVDMLIPKRDCKIEVLCKTSRSTTLIFMNERFVTNKKIIKVLNQQLESHFGDRFSTRKFVISLISINAPPSYLDVNLNPSKTQVLLKDEDIFLETFGKRLKKYYDPSVSANEPIVFEQEPCSSSNFENNQDDECEQEKEPSFKRRKLSSDSLSCHQGSISLDQRITLEEGSCHNVDKQVENLEINMVNQRSTITLYHDEQSSKPPFEADSRKSSQCNDDCANVNTCQSSLNVNHSTVPQCNTSEYESNFLDDWANLNEENSNPSRIFENNDDYIISSSNDLHVENENIVDDYIISSSNDLRVENENILQRESSPDLFPDSHLGRNPVASETSISTSYENENARDQVTLESWSMGHLQGDSGNLLHGACVLIEGRKEEASDNPSTSAKTLSESVSHNDYALSATDAVSVDACSNVSSKVCLQNSPSILKTTPSSPKRTSPKRKARSPRVEEVVDGLPLDHSLQSVSSQMGRRELSAFTKFAREVRPQIILENPGIAFTRVANMLADQWKNLSSNEREHYEEIARQTATNRKVWKNNDRQKTLDCFQIDKESTVKHNPPDMTVVRKEVVCDVTFECIKARCLRVSSSKTRDSVAKNGGISLIGQLKPSGSWICLEGPQIHLLNHFRLQEIVVYHRLLETFTLPLKAMSKKEEINPLLLGSEGWNTLMSFGCQNEMNVRVISDEVISKNGFRIEIHDEKGRAFITHVAETINFYGLGELKEVLQLANLSLPLKLSNCRPLRVKTHLQGEAMRICRKSPEVFERTLVQELLLYWETTVQFQLGNRCCLHSKPILTSVFDGSLEQTKKRACL